MKNSPLRDKFLRVRMSADSAVRDKYKWKLVAREMEQPEIFELLENIYREVISELDDFYLLTMQVIDGLRKS